MTCRGAVSTDSEVEAWGGECLLSYPHNLLSIFSLPDVEALSSAFASRCSSTVTLVSVLFTQPSGVNTDVNIEPRVTSATLGRKGLPTKRKPPGHVRNVCWFQGKKREEGKGQKRSGLQRKECVALYINYAQRCS